MTRTGFDLASYKDRFRRWRTRNRSSGPWWRFPRNPASPRRLSCSCQRRAVFFRRGGLPRLPADLKWPDDLTFVGALDCAAIPRSHLDLPYPEIGEILFFGDDSEGFGFSEKFRVWCVPDPSTASGRQPRARQVRVLDHIDYFATPAVESPSQSDYFASFMVTMARSELLSPETRRWITELGAHLPTPAHQIAVAMLHEDYLTNEMLRQWGMDRVTAGQVLRDLVEQGLALKEGGLRYARYVLDPAVSGRTEAPDLFSALPGEPTPDVGQALKVRGEATTGELAEATGLSRRAVQNHLRNMMEAGTIDAVGPTRSPKRRYRWIGRVD